MENWLIEIDCRFNGHFQKEHPVMILIPGNEVADHEADKDYSEIGKYNCVNCAVIQQSEHISQG